MANLTLLDWAKRVDPDGTTPVIANLLSQTNEIIQDAVYVQGNLPTGHRVTIATGLPLVYYRALNQGIPTSKATTAQVDEALSIIEARSEVDIDLAMLNGNEASFRMSEARMFLEAMNQAYSTGMFYGDPATDPREFLGLAPRYSSLSAGNAQNIIAAGGTTGDQTSIWLVGWGEQSAFCIFPKGSRAGLIHEDLGRQTSYDTGTTGERMEVYVDRFQWKTGLVVKDWRNVVRICNLQIADLVDLSAPHAVGTTDLLHQMAKAIARIPNINAVRPVFYCNRTVFTHLMRIALEKSSSALGIQAALSQFGTPSSMLSFLGVPIRQCDAIKNTEAVVS